MPRQMKDSGVEWMGMIPDCWNICKFKKSIESTNAGEVIDKSFWNDGDELLYTCQKTPMRSFYSNFPSSKRTTEKDLLLTRNATPYIFIPKENSIYSNVVQRVIVKDDFSLRFLAYATLQGAEALSVNGDTIPSYNMEVWKNIYIPMIEKEEQELIADFLDSKCAYIDSVIEKTKESIEEYKKLKQAIITEAVTKGVRGERPLKDSGIGWLNKIPNDWETRRLGTVFYERKEAGNDELPILQVSINTGISDHELSDDDMSRKFVRSEDRTVYKRVYPGDIAYNMMRAWQGAFGAARVNGMISPAYVVAAPLESDSLDNRYIEALLRTPAAIEEIHRYSHGIADFRLRLYWPQFKNIMVCLPSYEEQIEIADYIDRKTSELEDIIRKKQEFIDEMISYKKSLVYEFITGKRLVN